MLQILNHVFDIIKFDASPQYGSRSSSTKFSCLLPVLDVREIPTEQVIYEVLLDGFGSTRLEVISFDVICLELLQMALEVVVRDSLCHFALQTSALVELSEQVLLVLEEPLILAGCFQSHEIFRY